ncbi:MAG: transposase [Steroidobacteraceae bacterium]
MSEAELAASPVVGKARRAMRKFTAEQRQRIVADSVAPGATVRAVAERHCVFHPSRAGISRQGGPLFRAMPG